LSEIKGKDTYSNSGTFKSRITDPKRDFEPKGLKSFNGINYSNYICSTNNINSVNAGENDRRFCVITCNNEKANDKIYFMKFDNETVKNEEAVRCIYEYLKNSPLRLMFQIDYFKNLDLLMMPYIRTSKNMIKKSNGISLNTFLKSIEVIKHLKLKLKIFGWHL
jgi:hypothetical protein